MPLFPFTAIVEQERLKKALLLNAVNPAVGGVLIHGESGTAKSTAVRGLAEVMPEISVSDGCPFSCDPAAPCTRCEELAEAGHAPASMTRRRRVVDLPLNATEDRVAGTIDLARALREGVKALEPGLLAEANRGLLYIDEINLLDDHLVDLLLDAAALGVNTVEREGISASHPAQFLLVGTMNEQEGELRPQIADRLGLTVAVEPLRRAESRAEVMRRREQFNRDPEGFARGCEDAQRALSEQLEAASRALPSVVVPADHYQATAQMVVRSGIGSHRADIAVLECTKAIAALERRTMTTLGDIVEAAELVLPHRVLGDPFEPEPRVGASELRRYLEEALERPDAQKKTREPEVADTTIDPVEGTPATAELTARSELVLERPVPRDGLERAAIGRRAASLVTRRSGKYVRHRMNHEPGDADVAVDATLRAAAQAAQERTHEHRERASAGPARLRVEPDDLRGKIRAHHSPLSVVIVVDNSYSVHADRMVEKAKGLAQALLDDAAAKGDRVAVVAFNGGVPEATVAVPLTRSATLLNRRLATVPLAGRTPLPGAISLARRILRQELLKRPSAVPLVVVITDGLPTIPLRPGGDPLEDLLREARGLRHLKITTVVADTSNRRATVGGCGTELAEAAGGHWLPFDKLVPETLERVLERRARNSSHPRKAAPSRRARGADT